MQTENNAPAATTTTAPTGPADQSTQNTTPPTSGQGDASQAKTETGTEGTASTGAASTEGKEGEQGTQQEKASTEEPPRDEQGRYKPKLQKRIDELTHARHAAEREAARWRAIAEGQKPGAAPQAHEFASDEAYEAALRRHEAKEAARETAADQAKHAADQYQQDADHAIDAAYNERVQETAARIPDFVDVVSKADIKISHDMLAALKSSSHGPDIVYELAKNPAEAQRIAGLPSAQMYMALGAMEATAAAKATAAPNAGAATAPAARTTSAPPPAATGGQGAAPPNTDPSKMPMDEYKAWRRAQGSSYI